MRAAYRDSETSWNLISTNIIEVAKAAYYESVAAAELDRDEGAYVAMLFDKNGNDLIFCYHHDIEVAKRFIDGVMSLKLKPRLVSDGELYSSILKRRVAGVNDRRAAGVSRPSDSSVNGARSAPRCATNSWWPATLSYRTSA